MNTKADAKALATLTAAGGWIHVNDATPNIAQEVIVFSEFDGVTAGFLDSYDEWYCPNSNYKLSRVSHWMPLPAAPKADR